MSSNLLGRLWFAPSAAQPVSAQLGEKREKRGRRGERGRRGRVEPAQRDAIIADIARVAAATGKSHGLSFRAYAAGGGRYTITMIPRYGNWAYLCEAAGVRCANGANRKGTKRGSHSPILRALEPEPDPAPTAPITRDEVLADLLHIHAACGRPAAFAQRMYEEAGGRFTGHFLSGFGSWTSLCQAVNLSNGEGPRSQRRKWAKTRGNISGKEMDAALNRAIGWESPRNGLVRIMQPRRGKKKPRPADRETPVLQRRAAIMDLCEVAHSLGLSSPLVLNWQTYRDCGGRYTLEQIATLGGFTTLRRAAGKRA